MNRLTKKFFERETVEVAKDLLGCFLVRKRGKQEIRARIVEVEAYVGEEDLACHASRGRTKRTEVMYGEAGRAYVYLIYGMYHCLNVVTEKKDYPAAVLIRGVEIEGIPIKSTNGPGKLSRALYIDRALNMLDLTMGEKLWVEKGTKRRGEEVVATKRVGIQYAKHCAEYLWRFMLSSYSK